MHESERKNVRKNKHFTTSDLNAGRAFPTPNTSCTQRGSNPMKPMRWIASVFNLSLLGCGSSTPVTDGAVVSDSNGMDVATQDVGPDAAVTEVGVDVPIAVDKAPAVFTLTSPAYMEGETIPREHACTRLGGMNQSPPLAWTGAPAGAMSFAVFFKDVTVGAVFSHSAIYNIPSTVSELPLNVARTAMPANVPGARQPNGYPGSPGYAGPCPPQSHTYRFTIYALDTDSLTELTTNSSLATVERAFMTHSLGTATLTGTFTP
jgi:Raf kinase inhibitor-like YbhB/YbcL family protein